MFEKRVIVLKDETALKDVFVPERILHREGQKQTLGNCLTPVTINRSARNVFLHGPCGTGKTLLVNWTLKELESHSSACTAYVNCWKHNTTHACVKEILAGLDVHVSYRQSTDGLLDLLEKESTKKRIVICLDEVDALEDTAFLYNLSRADIGLVMISNDAFALADVDQRIKSSLNPEGIEFPAYTTEEVYDILFDRAKNAFVPGSIKPESVKAAARLCNGDARIGLETLRRAGLMVEDKEKQKIDTKDVSESFKSTQNVRKTQALKSLNEHEKALYLILEEKKEIDTKDLFEQYKKQVKNPSSQRSYRNYMSHLTRLGLVRSKGKLTGRKFEWLV